MFREILSLLPSSYSREHEFGMPKLSREEFNQLDLYFKASCNLYLNINLLPEQNKAEFSLRVNLEMMANSNIVHHSFHSSFKESTDETVDLRRPLLAIFGDDICTSFNETYKIIHDRYLNNMNHFFDSACKDENERTNLTTAHAKMPIYKYVVRTNIDGEIVRKEHFNHSEEDVLSAIKNEVYQMVTLMQNEQDDLRKSFRCTIS